MTRHNGATGGEEISVVIPVYGEVDLLATALESVGSQTLAPRETIVVDDGSDADYSDVLSEYDRVTLIRHEENRGAGAARNTGIDAAEGEYVAFLDVDDAWRPTKLERQLAAFRRGGDELGLVYTGFVQHGIDGDAYEHRPSARGEIYVEELERDRIHPTSTVMVRRECLDRVGGFDPELPSRQDYDLWIRITERYEVSYVDEVLVEKYEREDNISNDFDRRIAGDRAVMAKVRRRVEEFDLRTRLRVLSYHHHVLGRDYESNGNRAAAVKHLATAIAMYPFRPISWAMLVIAAVGIDRNGPLMNRAKRFVR